MYRYSLRRAFYIFLKINTNMKYFNLVKKLIGTYQVAALSGKILGITNKYYFRVAYGCLRLAMAKKGTKK